MLDNIIIYVHIIAIAIIEEYQAKGTGTIYPYTLSEIPQPKRPNYLASSGSST